ncbi:hypothetical protein ACP49_11955 [Clostridium botulinum]|uniref:Bacteriocin n=4 Tax=Clostridium TaxID=1485 RepID=A0A846I3R1_CLOBO|nr:MULTISPECIES: hypothetical protein [Clostridium]ACQ52092.1 hypothetical protein CLJ_B2236 [Clostridium botulinum Ba4 str. 657]AJE13179.1 hypothetical protein T259_2392 [Clostridium botulinum CDC_1436]APH20316.1 hypothetical protein NPD3_786 [Clostridium botulinum]AUM88044.1 hypothetical protein RSJ15_10170 [Clostridium botulinum]AUM91664.1 hypothetical protein RSJ5_10400 [Clostridium botulinum]
MRKTLIGEKDKLNTIQSRSGATTRGFCGCHSYCHCSAVNSKSSMDSGRIMVMLIAPTEQP